MSTSDEYCQTSGRDAAAAKPELGERLPGQPEPASRSARPVWTEAERERYRARQGAARPLVDLYSVRGFWEHLETALAAAQRDAGALTVGVFRLPDEWLKEEPNQPRLEIALRLDLRQTDLPTRLSTTTMAVALPGTGTAGILVVTRLREQLMSLVEGRVSAGIAFYPQDGATAQELLRAAFRRSLRTPSDHLDSELESLLERLTTGESSTHP